MSALEVFDDPVVTTQTAPSGAINPKFDRGVAANTSDLHIVSEAVYVDGVYVSRVLGAYWDRGTADAVARTFGATVSTVEVGAIPKVRPRDIH